MRMLERFVLFPYLWGVEVLNDFFRKTWSRFIAITFFGLTFSIHSLAQEKPIDEQVKIKGYFSSDSIELGKPISYFLTARYPEKMMVLFPDTTFKFVPFEFQKKKIIPTKTTNGISYDSVVYTLTTFEIDSIQSLQLPMYVVQAKDCTVVYPEKKDVFFKTAIVLPDSVQLAKLPLKTNTNYNPVAWLFNYPVAAIIVSAILVLLLIGWIVFGKRIRKHYRIKNLTQAHTQFLEQYHLQMDKTLSGNKLSAEAALVVWKKYLENLSSKPLTKLTTKEIREAIPNDSLALALNKVDRVIYAQAESEKDPFIQLEKFSEDKYHEKLEEIKNG
jgi:hypothetical protein